MSYIGELYEAPTVKFPMSTENYEEGSGDKIIQLEAFEIEKTDGWKIALTIGAGIFALVILFLVIKMLMKYGN